MQSKQVTRTVTLLAASLLLIALTPAMAQDMMYSEAPALAALVAAGRVAARGGASACQPSGR